MATYGNARIVPKEFVSMVDEPSAIECVCRNAARELLDKVLVEARKGECIIKLTEEQFDRYDQNAIELRETIEIQPLVRCKDCRYYRPDFKLCVMDGVIWGDNGYCSFGRRKENEA